MHEHMHAMHELVHSQSTHIAGDVYAHNILYDPDSQRAVLCDFGAQDAVQNAVHLAVHHAVQHTVQRTVQTTRCVALCATGTLCRAHSAARPPPLLLALVFTAVCLIVTQPLLP